MGKKSSNKLLKKFLQEHSSSKNDFQACKLFYICLYVDLKMVKIITPKFSFSIAIIRPVRPKGSIQLISNKLGLLEKALTILLT